MKNKILSDDGLTLVVESTKGRTFTIDKEDEYVLDNWWTVQTDGYVTRRFKGDKIYLHRELFNNPNQMDIDHKDLDPSNNKRNNIRVVTTSENLMNRSSFKNSTSKYKGVSWVNQTSKWRAQIGLNKKKYHIGYYATQEEAAEAYNKKALELFGKFSKLNIF